MTTDGPDDDAAAEVPPAIRQVVDGMRATFERQHPLFSELRFETLRVGRGDIAVGLTAPEAFSDGPEGAPIHPGFLTIVLDSICGMATFLALDAPQPIATINLKTDGLAPLSPGERLSVEARCEGLADDVALVRARAETGGRLVATAAATFMVGTRSAQVSRL